MMIQSILRGACVAATITICAMPAPALSQSAPVPVDAPVVAVVANAPVPAPVDAQTLAELLVPRQLFIDINMVNFEKGMAIMAKQAPELGELFKQYPGMEAALTTASGDVLRNILEIEYPDLKTKIATFVAERYTAADLAVLNSFYSGPAGRKLIRSEYESADAESMVKAFTDEDGMLTTDDVKAMEAKNRSNFGNDLNASEKSAATRFFLGKSGRKIAQNKADFQTLTVDWVNAVIAKHQSQIQNTTAETIMAFIEKSGTK